MWAVTVIGAPKKAAAQTIEHLEKDARGWYGGAVGMISLNGDINTGILIRTTYLRDGMAAYPVGATLLYDSVPAMEERETRLKATGFFRTLDAGDEGRAGATRRARATGAGVQLLLVDNDDCFIHTLANYARQTGAEVVTYRAGFPPELIAKIAPNLILISPGPGPARRFRRARRWCRRAVRLGVPVFGVCLGLQGIVEAFGGELGVLDYPDARQAVDRARIAASASSKGCPSEFQVGRYHSLFARRETLPGVPGSHGGDRGRRHHGRAPSRTADRGGAVPSGVDSHGGRRSRPEADGERDAPGQGAVAAQVRKR